MSQKILLITLCPENSQELDDFIKILNSLARKQKIKVKIISLAKLYRDNLFNNLLNQIQFPYEILEVQPIFKEKTPFPYLHPIKKILTVILNKEKIHNFISNSDIFLVGIQSVFQRLLYCISKAKGKTISFHRAILFPIFSKTSRGAGTINKIFKKILKLLRIEYIISPKSGIGYADYYFVLGENNKKYLELHGIPSERIFITGSPTYDEVGNFKKLNKRNNLGGKIINLYYITSAFEWIGDEKGESRQRRKIKEIIKLCQTNSNIKLTIRVHPREPTKKYQNLERKYPFLKIDYYKSINLLRDLSKYDIICGGLSNVLFEAMLIDKLVIFYLLKEEVSLYRHILRLTRIKYFTNIEEIENFIKKVKDSTRIFSSYLNTQRSIVRKIIYCDSEKKAADRISDLLLDLFPNIK